MYKELKKLKSDVSLREFPKNVFQKSSLNVTQEEKWRESHVTTSSITRGDQKERTEGFSRGAENVFAEKTDETRGG